ncbi:MAG TPA: TIGR02679 family protein [Anaeromyxobacteraceae bacterium]|nr:TIGR02679 family protein [Anaeromyxobacteraceae bacterium]
MSADRQRIGSLLGGPGYAKLFAAARARLEDAGDAARTVTVEELGVGEARALADLFGWQAAPEQRASVVLAELDRALRESAAQASLREVLEALGGPLRDARADRDRGAAERQRMWTEAEARVASRPELCEWLARLRTTGALTRAATAAERATADLLAEAVTVAQALPAAGCLLPVLAARCTGDPHALDPGTPLGGLALRAAVAVAGWEEVPAAAAERRRLWREVGVDCDALSAEVLVLGLRPPGDGLLARHLRDSAEAGEPRRVTLRELGQAAIAVEPGTPVHVCENPAIVAAAADALGARCRALVCVEGVPSTAAMDLLRALARSGASVRVHADFDWAGLRIAHQVLEAAGGRPWRFERADYLEAAATMVRAPRLTGRPADTPWSPGLEQAMRERGIAVPEERLLSQLLGDLEG